MFNTDRIISVTVNDLTHTSNTAQTFLHVVENVPTPGTAAAAVDDDGLAGGNAASTAGDLDANVGDADGAASSEATFSGVLGGSVGNDVPGTFSFAALAGTTAAVGLETVTYGWDAASRTLTATRRPARPALFTVHVTNPATGAYAVTLLDNVLHAGGPNDEATDAVVNLGYVITDANGSTAPGTLTVAFNDDAPTAAVNASVQLDDDALAGGNAGGSGDIAPDTANTTGTLAHGYGADGAGTTLLTAAGSLLPTGFTAVVSNGGQTLTISQGATAVLRIQLADTISGGYTVTQLAVIDHPIGGDRGQPPVHGQLRGHRRRRRHRDRLAVDRRRRRHADGVGEPAGAARRRCADGWQCRRRWR